MTRDRRRQLREFPQLRPKSPFVVKDAEPRGGLIRRIVAPVDFSSHSRASLAFAAHLAHQCGAELHVVHVQPPLLDAVARSQHIDLLGETRDELMAFVNEACPRSGVVTVPHVQAGPPIETIQAIAVKCRADLIVMGPRGRSPLAASLLGSTTQGLLQQAPCPVTVVPAATTETPGDGHRAGQ